MLSKESWSYSSFFLIHLVHIMMIIVYRLRSCGCTVLSAQCIDRVITDLTPVQQQTEMDFCMSATSSCSCVPHVSVGGWAGLESCIYKSFLLSATSPICYWCLVFPASLIHFWYHKHELHHPTDELLWWKLHNVRPCLGPILVHLFFKGEGGELTAP